MLFAVFLAAVLFVWAILNYAPLGRHGVMTANALGCRTKEDTAAFLGFIAHDDNTAALAFFLAKLATGDCRRLSPGTSVTLQGLSRSSGLVCVRLAEESGCLWVNVGSPRWD